jgi:hypothetical protein
MKVKFILEQAYLPERPLVSSTDVTTNEKVKLHKLVSVSSSVEARHVL